MFSLIRPALLTLILALVVAPSMALGQILDPIPTKIVSDGTTVTLTRVDTPDVFGTPVLTAPFWASSAPGDLVVGRLFIADRAGTIYYIDAISTTPIAFLDVKTQIAPLATAEQFDLLGVAFHPDYATNGLFYTYTFEPADITSTDLSTLFSTLPTGTIATRRTVLREWKVTSPTTSSAVVDALTGPRILFRVDQPQSNNNGGAMGFDDDDDDDNDYLYIGIGDGGGVDDMDSELFDDTDNGIPDPMPISGHGAGNGQDTSTVLGSILRIDPIDPPVNPSVTDVGAYSIPNDNPNVFGTAVGGSLGCDDFDGCDEIFAYGFRNPTQLSFDSRGLLIVSDEGQNIVGDDRNRDNGQNIEEINFVYSGFNYGWNRKAGRFFFDPTGSDTPGILIDDQRADTARKDPVAQYDHDEGLSVRGGFFYPSDGPVVDLQLHYIFGDASGPNSATPTVCAGRLFLIEPISQTPPAIAFLVETNDLKLDIVALQTTTLITQCILGFGQDNDGNVYVLTNNTGRTRLDVNVGEIASGAVLRIDP